MDAKNVLINYQNFAVIGVTNNHDKYGYKIFQRLKQLNKTIYGISPIYKDIDGIATYSSLSEVNKKIDVAVFVVNPQLGIKYVKECQKLKINHIWLQPGTYNDKLISIIKDASITYYPNCILVESQDI